MRLTLHHRLIFLVIALSLAGCATGPSGPSQPPCGISADSYYKWSVARDKGLDYAAVKHSTALAETAGQALSLLKNESLAERKARAAEIAAMSAAQKWIYAHPKLTPVEIQDAVIKRCGNR